MKNIKQLSEALKTKLGLARSITPEERASDRDPWLMHAYRYQQTMSRAMKAPTLRQYKKITEGKQ